MTAHATIEERRRCLAAGMNGHIPKPIDPGDLLETVGRFYKPADDGAAVTQDSNPATPSRDEPGDDLAIGGTAALKTCAAIAGLDTKDGLGRVAGNQKLYLKLLRQFIEEQGPSAVRIADTLTNGDTALAERLAHTLKGVAGNIGAKPVQHAAATLEKLIRAKAAASEMASANRNVAAALDPLVDGLRAALDSPATQALADIPPAEVSPSESREAAARLIKLLSDFDPGAADFIEANHAALRPLFKDGRWPEFEKLVQGYSFADAQAQLEQALKNLHVV
jgi:two-component system sensor histidine kinase/response regulator